jgi:hypothetical protein
MLDILWSCERHESFVIIISACVGFLYLVKSNFVLSLCIKIQEINGVVFFFLNSEFYIGSLFVEFSYSFVYICFLFIANYENVTDISKISNYFVFVALLWLEQN